MSINDSESSENLIDSFSVLSRSDLEKLARRIYFENQNLKADNNQKLSRDPVTGLYTRNQLLDCVYKDLGKKLKVGCFVLFIDVDNLKEVNDSLGHMVGDKMLISLSDCLKRSIRGSDYIGKWTQGDEFVIVLSETDEQGGHTVVERIKRFLPKNIKISVGGAKAKSGDDVIESINEADKAMYRAKKNKETQRNVGFVINNYV